MWPTNARMQQPGLKRWTRVVRIVDSGSSAMSSGTEHT
jgi:hypothetical protein